jgi:hypothetical protein
VKSSSSIFTADGSDVISVSKVVEGWDIGRIVGTAWWVGCIATANSEIYGWVCSIGAGRASILGEVSISVSLDDSAVWRMVMFLVCTMFVSLGLKRLQKGL